MFNSSKKSSFSPEEQVQQASNLLASLTPITNIIYKNRAIFAFNKGVSLLTEIFFYLLGFACIAFSFIMNNVFPFHIIDEILSKHVYEQAMTNKGEIETFTLAIKGLVILIGLLFIFIGIRVRSNGKRLDLLQQAGTQMKAVESFLTQIKANGEQEKGMVENGDLKPVTLKDFPATE